MEMKIEIAPEGEIKCVVRVVPAERLEVPEKRYREQMRRHEDVLRS